LELVTVALLKENGEVIKSTSTDSTGHFSFTHNNEGIVLIRCLFAGYKDSVYRQLQIRENRDIDVGEIQLPQSHSLLREITVTGTKILVEDKGDRLVYNASSDIGSKSGSATDLLKKVPMISANAEGELQMRGNSNIKVLLNGRPSAILAKNLKQALKTIPASSIQSIEVITSPFSKYEADGANGVINIITKQKREETEVILDMSGGNLTQSGSGMLNVAHPKFNFNLSASMNRDRMRTLSEIRRTSLVDGEEKGNLIQREEILENDRGGQADATIAYIPDSTQEFSATIMYWRGKWPSDTRFYNKYESNEQITEYNQYSKQRGVFNLFDGELSYQKRFNQKGRELLMSGQYSKGRDNTSYITRQYTMSNTNYFTERSPNIGSETEWSGQTDYVHPLGKKKNYIIESGLRYAKNTSSSNYKVFNNHNNAGGELTGDSTLANRMDYHQNIFAAYASIKLETLNKWSLRIGTRYEGTRVGGKFENDAPGFRSSFHNFVPSIYISKKLNDQQDIKFSYTTRIRRPWIWDLNPYVNASDPRNITSGNPRLRPETIRMVEAGHSYTRDALILSSSIFFSNSSSAIESLAIVDSLGVSRSTPRNIAFNKTMGASINGFLMLRDNWSVNAGVEVYYISYRSKALSTKNKGTIYSFNANSIYELRHGFSIQINGSYDNGQVTLQGKTSGNYNYQFSARKELMDKKLVFSFTTTNPFQQSFRQHIYTHARTFDSVTDSKNYNRSFSAALSYNLGMEQSREERNSVHQKNGRKPFPK
jgi:outer membrane receptor for ferrienterochelin and colicin